MRHSSLALLSSLLLSTLACGQGLDDGSVDDSAPGAPSVPALEGDPGPVGDVTDVPAWPLGALPYCDVAFTPAEVRFGVVEPGSTGTIEVELRNEQPFDCIVRNLRLCEGTDEAFTLVNGPQELVLIPAHAEYRTALRFRPDEETCGTGPEGCLEVQVGPAPEDRSTVTFACGDGNEPPALVAPDVVDFGSVRPGCATRDRELQVINVTSSPIAFASVEIAEGGTDEFLVRYAPAAGTVIPPGQALPLVVAYRPTDAGPDSGTVLVRIEGYSEPLSAGLIAGGAAPTVQRDSYLQGLEGLRTCFYLANRPEDVNGDGAITEAAGELRVWVDEKALASTDGDETVWTYDATPNAVCFAPGHVPADRAIIDIEYRVSCLAW